MVMIVSSVATVGAFSVSSPVELRLEFPMRVTPRVFPQIPQFPRDQVVGGIQFTRQGSESKCDIRNGDGILWKCPLIPRAEVSADTVAVGRQVVALATVVLPLAIQPFQFIPPTLSQIPNCRVYSGKRREYSIYLT